MASPATVSKSSGGTPSRTTSTMPERVRARRCASLGSGEATASPTARKRPTAWAERSWPRRRSSPMGVSGAGVRARRFSASRRAHSASWPGSIRVLRDEAISPERDSNS